MSEELSPKERVINALLGKPIDRIPASSVAGCGGTVCVEMQEIAGIYWPDAHRDAEKMAKLAIKAQELSGLDNVRVPFDFVIEPEALGCTVKFPPHKDAVPMVYEHPYKSPEDLRMPDDITKLGRIPILLKAIRVIKEEVGERVPVSSLVLGPMTLAGELVGVEKLMVWCRRKPEWVFDLVDFSTEFLIKLAEAECEAGSDIIQVGDPTAGPDLISPDMFRRFAMPALIKIAKSIPSDKLKVLHICGNATSIVGDMAKCGYHGISIEESVDVAKAKPLVGNVKILGNISSKKTLLFGTPDEVKEECRRAIEAGVDLLEPGCGFAPGTPLANIRAMVEAAKEYGRKRK